MLILLKLNSRLTKALITRASLEVDIHRGQVTVALSRFLEEDFSPAYLGLTRGARNHLDQFRTFLHGFYVQKFGYWPPPRGSAYPKALYKSMYYDFKNLYEFLVDSESTTDFTSQAPASGGICVLQNVDSFDKRHKFVPQLHPLPLLPSDAGNESPAILRRRSLSPEHNIYSQFQVASVALAEATNSDNESVMNSRIVHSYMHYEATYSLTANLRGEKVSIADARKIRWLVIYGTLQYLVSALHAPAEVRDAETPDYPLCCLVSEKSSWSGYPAVRTPSLIAPTTSPVLADRSIATPLDVVEIEPDCSREDYFTCSPESIRSSSDNASLFRGGILTPKVSTRSTRPRSSSAAVSRKNSLALGNRQYCEIIVHGFGNGLHETVAKSPVLDHSHTEGNLVDRSYRSSTSAVPDGAGPNSSWLQSPRTSALITEKPTLQQSPILQKPPMINNTRHTRTRTPHMDTLQLEQFLDTVDYHRVRKLPSRSNSSSSTRSQVWSEASMMSSASSAYEGYTEHKSNAVETSGLASGLGSLDSSAIPDSRTPSFIKAMIPAPLSIAHDSRPSSYSQGPETPNSTHAYSESELSTIGMAYTLPPAQPVRPSIDSQLSISFDPPAIARYASTDAYSPPATPTARYTTPPSTSSSDSRRNTGIFTSLSSAQKQLHSRFGSLTSRSSVKDKRSSFWHR
jgi:hypothetical protein